MSLPADQLVELLTRAVYDLARAEGTSLTVVCLQMGIPPGVIEGDTRREVRGR